MQIIREGNITVDISRKNFCRHQETHRTQCDQSEKVKKNKLIRYKKFRI